VKIALVLLHLLKATPLFRSLDISNLFLPFKVAAVHALTLRDAAGLPVPQSFVSDIVILTIAAMLIGLMLLPRPATVPSGAGQK
jgi:hypothetical protein